MKKLSIKRICCISFSAVAVLIVAVVYLWLRFTHLGVPPEDGVWVSEEHSITIDVDASEIELVYNGTLQKFNIYCYPQAKFDIIDLDHEGDISVPDDLVFYGTIERYFDKVHFKSDDGQIDCWLERAE